jgi:hypothetical protein
MISVSSQKGFKNNPEPSAQAFPVNGVNSPIKLSWMDLPGGRKQVTMTTDFISHAHPAKELGYFVFYQFGEHKKHNGTKVWPAPSSLRLRFNARYKEVLPRGEEVGRTRWMAMMVAYWTDTNGDRKSRMIEVMPYISESWKNSEGSIDPVHGIINHIVSDKREYVAVLGDVIGQTTQSKSGETFQPYDINWGDVIDYLTSTPVIPSKSSSPRQTYLTPPGVNPQASVLAVTLATETHVRSARINCALSELTFHSFRIDNVD